MFLRVPSFWLLIVCLLPLQSYAQADAFTLADWPATETKLKPVYVKAIMEQAQVHEVRFDLPADFYVDELNKFAIYAAERNIHPWLKTSVAQNLATLAVIHCDWNNGVPPWEFAQRYLGSQQLELLKPGYSNALSRLQRNCVD